MPVPGLPDVPALYRPGAGHGTAGADSLPATAGGDPAGTVRRHATSHRAAAGALRHRATPRTARPGLKRPDPMPPKALVRRVHSWSRQMFSQLIRSLPLCAAGLLVLPADALAHAVCGERVFPATLGIDDPGINDELSNSKLSPTCLRTPTVRGSSMWARSAGPRPLPQCRHSDFGRSDLPASGRIRMGPPEHCVTGGKFLLGRTRADGHSQLRGGLVWHGNRKPDPAIQHVSTCDRCRQGLRRSSEKPQIAASPRL